MRYIHDVSKKSILSPGSLLSEQRDDSIGRHKYPSEIAERRSISTGQIADVTANKIGENDIINGCEDKRLSQRASEGDLEL